MIGISVPNIYCGRVVGYIHVVSVTRLMVEENPIIMLLSANGIHVTDHPPRRLGFGCSGVPSAACFVRPLLNAFKHSRVQFTGL